MSTDDTTPTPAPVAVPEGGWRDGDLIQIRFSNGDYEVVERRDGFFGDYADGEISRWMERAMVVSVIAPREAYGEPNDTTQHAPRPEPVTAPLPSEAVDAWCATVHPDLRIERIPGAADPRHRVAACYECQRGWAAALPHLLPAADQRARDEGTVRREIAQAVLDLREKANPDNSDAAVAYRSALRDVLRVLDGSR